MGAFNPGDRFVELEAIGGIPERLYCYVSSSYSAGKGKKITTSWKVPWTLSNENLSLRGLNGALVDYVSYLFTVS
jgi:hypothetical protein